MPACPVKTLAFLLAALFSNDQEMGRHTLVPCVLDSRVLPMLRSLNSDRP